MGMQHLRVWLFKISENIPNREGTRPRTFQIADALLTRGHEVLWWNSAFDHPQKRFDSDRQGIRDFAHRGRIIYLPSPGYKRNASLMRYLDHWILSKGFRKAASLQRPPNVMVIAMPDLHLATEAMKYARMHGIPTIIDVRDQWPDVFVEAIPKPLKAVGAIALAPLRWKLRRLLSDADSIVSMMETVLEWSLRCASRSKTANDRVFYLATGRKRKTLGGPECDRFKGLIEALRGRFCIFYVGTFGLRNNPVILLEAARILNSKIDPRSVAFVIGGGGAYECQVKQIASGLPNCFLPGWLNEREISLLAEQCHLAVIPGTEEIVAYPNKAFFYMAAGLPIVASVKGDLRSHIEEKGIGLLYDAGSPESLAQTIRKAFDSKELLSRMKQSVEGFYSAEMNPEHIYHEFAIHIEHIAATSSKAK
jgi:glycosyltransferase involved in cell wall biosynthesis